MIYTGELAAINHSNLTSALLLLALRAADFKNLRTMIKHVVTAVTESMGLGLKSNKKKSRLEN